MGANYPPSPCHGDVPQIIRNDDGTITLTLTKKHVAQLLTDTGSAKLPHLGTSLVTDRVLLELQRWYKS